MATDGAGASLMSEVEALGVSVCSVSLSEVLDAVGEPGRTLARHFRVPLAGRPAPASAYRCLCDRTLARQAVLSALGALLAAGPEQVFLTAAGARREARIELSIVPPLPQEAASDLTERLVEARVLMTAQAGAVALIRGAGGEVEGLRLSFPPESVAHVLVVDDNEKMLRLYERYLMVGRYSVTCAASAPEAEALLEDAVPDAIVLDVMMREVDGWELLQRLRSDPRLGEVPIVVASILNEPAMAQALGATAYLRKPVTADGLLAALGQVLGGSSREERRPAAP